MGFFSSIVSGISSVCSAVCSCVSSLCSRIGSSVFGTAVSSFVSTLGIPSLSPLDIIKTIIIVADVVCKIAEALGLKKENEDEPDELAMKAEKDDTKPEDYDSVEAYIKHLQEDIKLTKEDREKLDEMSDDERSAYRATGTYLYTKAVNENLGFDNSGLKNPGLAGLTAEILVDLAKIQNIIQPSDFAVYSKNLQAEGMDMKQFSNYLHNRSENLTADEKVQKALAESMAELNPEITDDEINQKLYALNIED